MLGLGIATVYGVTGCLCSTIERWDSCPSYEGESLDVMSAVQGPSVDVFSLGTLCCSLDGQLHWDNDFSTSEIDLLCGVYKLPTGQGVQTTDMSWWLKQSMWVGSNVDVGYWSPDNEVWFRACLAKIGLVKYSLRVLDIGPMC